MTTIITNASPQMGDFFGPVNHARQTCRVIDLEPIGSGIFVTWDHGRPGSRVTRRRMPAGNSVKVWRAS